MDEPASSSRDEEQAEEERGTETPPRRNSRESEMAIDFDSALEEIGQFGKYQKILYYTVCSSIIFTTCLGLSVVFTAAIPKARCFIPTCDNLTHPSYSLAFDAKTGFANFTIPKEESGGFSTCSRFTVKNSTTTATCDPEHFDEHDTFNCTHDKIYDKTYYKSTIVSEFELLCGEEWKVPVVESVMFVGVMVAALVGGLLADKFGRRHVFMSALLITFTSGLCLAFSTNYWMFLVFQFLAALGQAAAFQTAFILAVESVGKSKRVFCGIVIEYFFVVGEVTLTLMAYLFGNWRYIIGITLAPIIIFLFGWPLLPESVRWLVANRRDDEAEAVIAKMAKVNGVEGFDISAHKITRPSTDERSESLLAVIKCWILLKRFLNMCFCWLVVTMVYYGLSLNATTLAGSPYTNFLLVALVEIPGYTLSFWTMECMGRMKSTALSLVICSLSCYLSAVGHAVSALETVAFLMGKLAVTWTFGNIYVYTTELFPTSARTACVGMCSTAGRIGAIVSPYIAGLALDEPWIPMVVFGTLAFVSGVLVFLFLPETLNCPLPECIDDALAEVNAPTPNLTVNASEEPTERSPLI